MFCVGLTGGIASGKSIVAKLFAEHSAYIIDADVVSHQLTEPGEKIYTDIVNHFGICIKRNDGSLDRSKLAEVIFQDAGQRKWLEELLHPAIEARIESQLQAYSATSASATSTLYVILVVPLLIEAQWQHKVDRICVVDVTREQQINRLVENRSLTSAVIDNTLAIQASRELRLQYADDVIDNRGDVSQLRSQVRNLDALYRRFSLGSDES